MAGSRGLRRRYAAPTLLGIIAVIVLLLLLRPRHSATGGVSRRALRVAPMAPHAAHIVGHVDTYPDKVKELLTLKGPHFIIFSADPNPDTGLPWCPDCVRALPVVTSVVLGKDASVLELQVGPRATWKSPDHPFRHEPLKLTGIPTLIKVDETGTEVGRLGEELESAESPADVKTLLDGFIN